MIIDAKNIFRLQVTQDQCKDAGMAFVLVLLILKFVFGGDYWLIFAVALLVITMCAPGVLRPPAKVWFGMAQFIGTYVSKIILFLVFYAIVTPVGRLRRLLKKDTLKLNEFKKGRKSVMDERNVTYKPEDIVKPF